MTYNSEVLAQHGWYVSPGVQIGIDSNGDLHRAAQITLGILTEEYPFTTGLTIGYKWFRQFDNSNEKSWKRYNYYDLQIKSSGSIILPGVGFGLIRGENMSLTRFFIISFAPLRFTRRAPKKPDTRKKACILK